MDSSHPGQSSIRGLYDAFTFSGPHGEHQCLVQPPMHLSVLDMMNSNPEPLNAPLLRMVLKSVLTALDFLHTEAEIIHTGLAISLTYAVTHECSPRALDLKADNLMLAIADKSMYEDFEKAEMKDPSPRKIIDEARTIYTSRRFGKPKNDRWGPPVLCDLGQARIGQVQETGPMIQPHIYRAPEVTFEIPWGPPVDIWNVATLVLFSTYLESRNMLNTR